MSTVGEYREIKLPDDPEKYIWHRWAANAGFNDEAQWQSIFKSGRLQYDDSLIYHNFDHAVEVTRGAMELADNLKSHDKKASVNRKVLLVAALFHDAGYHVSQKVHGFDSKEAYSGKLAMEAALRHGIEVTDILAITKAIRATQPGADIPSLEARLLVRADIDNMGQDYEAVVSPVSELLQREVKLIADRTEAPFDLIKYTNDNFIARAAYLAKVPTLGDFDNEWLVFAKENLRIVARLNAEEQGFDYTISYLRSLGSEAVNQVFDLNS